MEIKIPTGVKQGDPLSPLLLNLCLEPLLDAIEEQPSSIDVSNERKVPILAFADNIVLLDEVERKAQRQVYILHGYPKALE